MKVYLLCSEVQELGDDDAPSGCRLLSSCSGKRLWLRSLNLAPWPLQPLLSFLQIPADENLNFSIKRYFSSLYETVQPPTRSAAFYCYSTCASPSTHKAADKLLYRYCVRCVWVFWGWGVVTNLWKWRQRGGKALVGAVQRLKLLTLKFLLNLSDLVQVRCDVLRAAAACDGHKEPSDLNAPPGFTWLLNILKGSLCVCCVWSSSYEWWTERVKYERCNCVIKSSALSVCTARRRFFAFTFRRDVIKELWDFFCDHMRLLNIFQRLQTVDSILVVFTRWAVESLLSAGSDV